MDEWGFVSYKYSLIPSFWHGIRSFITLRSSLLNRILPLHHQTIFAHGARQAPRTLRHGVVIRSNFGY